MPDLKWLDYSGETLDQLLSFEGEYRTDSLVVACEQAIMQKLARDGEAALSEQERAVVAVEALEREVNNGGYQQFFVNTPEFVATIVDSLSRIGCTKTAEITRKALDALGLPRLDVETVNATMEEDSCARDEKLNRCDQLYYEAGEDIAGQLFNFIKANRGALKF